MKLPPLSPADLKRIQLQAQAERERRIREGTWTGGVNAHTAYQKKPVEWMVEFLDIPENTIRWSLNPGYEDHVWDGDKDPLVKALTCISEGGSVAVSSGTTTGKTFVLGAAGTLWFLACFDRSIAFSVAPKQDLLLKNMWKEIGELWPRFKRHFPTAQLLTGNLRMLDGEGEQELWAATAFGAGVGANEEMAQRLKGFHRDKMLWIIEEMPGVDQAIIETIIKTAASDFNPIMGFGNPEHQHDPLAAFGRREWVTPIRISAHDFPNVVCDKPIIPGGRSRASVERDLQDAGGDPNAPSYLSQVRGIAPAQSRRALIQWDWCEAAAKRWGDQELRKGPLALGVDPADSPTGDESAISRWQGAVCTEVEGFRAQDASEVGRMVYREMMNPENPIDPKHVGIDAVGVGASTVNELKGLGVRVRRISGGTRAVPMVDIDTKWRETETDIGGVVKPIGPTIVEAETYANTRSQVLWRLREDLRLGRVGLPNDKMLFEELTAMEYEEPNGRITVEPKKHIKARIGRSPDRAEAVAYGNFVRRRTPVRTTIKPDLETTPNVDRGLERLLARREKERKAEHRRMMGLLKRRAGARR